MKNLLIPFFILSIIVGCDSSPKNNLKASIVQKDSDSSGDKDTIVISANDSFKLSKVELRKVIKDNPELDAKQFILAPENTYYSRRNTDGYNCELCKDQYYELYAYFLKSKQSSEKFNTQRETLIKIYRDINEIYSSLARGGTYYAHQYSRILGDAEYAVYLYKNSDYYNKRYNISKQKALFINSLKQVIADETENDNELSPKEVIEVKTALFKTVNELNGLITNYFYLANARTFQYSNY